MEENKLVKKKKKAKRSGNHRQLADLSKELGDLYYYDERLEEALAEYEDQLKACKQLKNELECVIAHKMIGDVQASLGNYQEALIHQNLYLEGAKKFDNVPEQLKALSFIGTTHFCIGENLPKDSEEREKAFAAAYDTYTQSLKLCERPKCTGSELTEMMGMKASALLNLGLVLEEQKHLQPAVDIIEKSAEICREYKLEDDLCRTHGALGTLYERLNNFDLALKHVDMSIEIGNSTLRAVSRLAKAEMLLRFGRWSEARRILIPLYRSKDLESTTSEEAEKLLRIVVTISRAEKRLKIEKNPQSRQKLYEQLGDASARVQSYEKAIDYYRQMWACAEAEKASQQIRTALLRLVETFREANRFNEAIPIARRELQLCTSPTEICRSAQDLADLLYLTNHDRSAIMEIYNNALRTARGVGSRSLEASVLVDVHYYLKATGNHAEAEGVQKKLDSLADAIVDTTNDEQIEETNIGAEICLDDLSDDEDQTKINNNVTKKILSTLEDRLIDSTPSPTVEIPSTKRGLIKRNEKGETKLHVACTNGNLEEVTKLLASGHPTNVKDNAGWTPLHKAASRGYVEITKLLIKSGANVNDPGGIRYDGATRVDDNACCGGNPRKMIKLP